MHVVNDRGVRLVRLYLTDSYGDVASARAGRRTPQATESVIHDNQAVSIQRPAESAAHHTHLRRLE